VLVGDADGGAEGAEAALLDGREEEPVAIGDVGDRLVGADAFPVEVDAGAADVEPGAGDDGPDLGRGAEPLPAKKMNKAE
jgi:hypothetical protein